MCILDENLDKPLANAHECCFVSLSRADLRVGIIGLASKDTIKNSKTSYTFNDYISSARAISEKLKTVYKCEFIIALTHMSWWHDINLQQHVPSIDLILGGLDKDYGVVPKMTRSELPLVVKSGADFKSFSSIDVFRNRDLDEYDIKIELKWVNVTGNVDLVVDHDLYLLKSKFESKMRSMPLFKLNSTTNLRT